MNRLQVITRASDRVQARLLELSASRLELDLLWLDGQQDNASLEVYLDLIAAVGNSDASHLLLTDSFDVLAVRWDPGEVLARIEAARGNLIVSCEKACWPEGGWCLRYPEAPRVQGASWNFLCMGQFCGRRAEILSFLREVYDRRDTVVAGGSSQEIAHRMFVGGWALSRDTGCEIFQSMLGTADDEVVRDEDGTVRNTVTGSRPMFLHFNGGRAGMQDWRERLSLCG